MINALNYSISIINILNNLWFYGLALGLWLRSSIYAAFLSECEKGMTKASTKAGMHISRAIMKKVS